MTTEPTAASGRVRIPLPNYERLGGVGVTRTLWECQRCGCAVSDKAVHDRKCKS